MRRDRLARVRSALSSPDRPVTRLRSAFRPRERLLAAAVAVLAGAAVFAIATEVFPYHSVNHDEGVYLQQAAMLLSGQFELYPGGLGNAVRPWFFVDAGDRFYPKYQPLPAALYAVSMAAVGEPRVTLAAIAAGNAALVYVLGAAAFDRRVGVLAAACFAAAPMTLVTSSVFLPYAPTAFFTLAFAALYLRSLRTGRVATAALAGAAIGLAFFARPYTAVLFALPFAAHALWEVTTAVRDRDVRTALRDDRRSAGRDGSSAFGTLRPLPGPLGRQGATATVGLAFVAVALAYNASITGSPLVFPYEAFAPRDGPGFGRREILGHSIDYTPAVALRANGYALWYLLTRWVSAGVVGTALAAVGLVASARRWAVLPGDGAARVLLAGLFVSVPLGNLLFWGNYNVLGTASDPTDGLIAGFGPFYHFDLLAPVAIFAAAGAVGVWRRRDAIRERAAVGPLAPVLADRSPAAEGSSSPSTAGRALLVAILLAGALLLGGVNAALVADPVERHAARTATYEEAYAPFEERALENAVVFLPTPYGEWLNHPFQYLRNEPGFDGPAVYALERDAAGDFAVLDALPDREYYRYTYRGEWTPYAGHREFVPRLEPLSVRSGDRLAGETAVGVPDRVSHATVRIETGRGAYASRTVDDPGDEIAVSWSIEDDGAVALEAIDDDAVDAESLSVDGADEVVVQVRLVQSEGETLTYRQEVSVRTTDGEVEAIWPPERTVCPLVDDCGREGTYLPDRSEGYPDGVAFETRLVEESERSKVAESE